MCEHLMVNLVDAINDVFKYCYKTRQKSLGQKRGKYYFERKLRIV